MQRYSLWAKFLRVISPNHDHILMDECKASIFFHVRHFTFSLDFLEIIKLLSSNSSFKKNLKHGRKSLILAARSSRNQSYYLSFISAWPDSYLIRSPIHGYSNTVCMYLVIDSTSWSR